jgi:hypothetical protein
MLEATPAEELDSVDPNISGLARGVGMKTDGNTTIRDIAVALGWMGHDVQLQDA